jgi:hypothetical protein
MMKLVLWLDSHPCFWLLTSETTSGGEMKNGCVKVESLDLASFAMDVVPIMVVFHGGGMTLGIPGDPETLGESVALAGAFLERGGLGHQGPV